MNIVAITFAISLLFPCLVSAHGGGLDAQGGHRDRKANNYHFHQGPLEGKTYASKDAATAALATLELAATTPLSGRPTNTRTPSLSASSTSKSR